MGNTSYAQGPCGDDDNDKGKADNACDCTVYPRPGFAAATQSTAAYSLPSAPYNLAGDFAEKLAFGDDDKKRKAAEESEEQREQKRKKLAKEKRTLIARLQFVEGELRGGETLTARMEERLTRAYRVLAKEIEWHVINRRNTKDRGSAAVLWYLFMNDIDTDELLQISKTEAETAEGKEEERVHASIQNAWIERVYAFYETRERDALPEKLNTSRLWRSVWRRAKAYLPGAPLEGRAEMVMRALEIALVSFEVVDAQHIKTQVQREEEEEEGTGMDLEEEEEQREREDQEEEGEEGEEEAVMELEESKDALSELHASRFGSAGLAIIENVFTRKNFLWQDFYFNSSFFLYVIRRVDKLAERFMTLYKEQNIEQKETVTETEREMEIVKEESTMNELDTLIFQLIREHKELAFAQTGAHKHLERRAMIYTLLYQLKHLRKSEQDTIGGVWQSMMPQLRGDTQRILRVDTLKSWFMYALRHLLHHNESDESGSGRETHVQIRNVTLAIQHKWNHRDLKRIVTDSTQLLTDEEERTRAHLRQLVSNHTTTLNRVMRRGPAHTLEFDNRASTFTLPLAADTIENTNRFVVIPGSHLRYVRTDTGSITDPLEKKALGILQMAFAIAPPLYSLVVYHPSLATGELNTENTPRQDDSNSARPYENDTKSINITWDMLVVEEEEEEEEEEKKKEEERTATGMEIESV